VENLTQPLAFIGKYDTFLLRSRRRFLVYFQIPLLTYLYFWKNISYL